VKAILATPILYNAVLDEIERPEFVSTSVTIVAEAET